MLAELDAEEEWYRPPARRAFQQTAAILRFTTLQQRLYILPLLLRYFDGSASPPLLYLYYNGTTPPPADFELVAVTLQVCPPN